LRALDDRAFWIALSHAAGIGPIRFQRLLEVFGDACTAWSATDFDLVAAGLDGRTVLAINRLRQRTSPQCLLDQLHHLGITAVTLQDQEYPANLRQVADPPPVLFTRGQFTPADSHAVALVGTRRASPYGRSAAERLAADLAIAGVTVVSGLARGIDTSAHQAALQAGGRTLAVLGNGLDQVYPPSNAGLARRIIESNAGALVSEFSPGIPPDAVNFPRRNRIISGLSRLTVIVEAGERSGALITADFALEQGRDVLVVPGSIFSPTSVGTNQLLKQGATPVTCAEDILEVLESTPPEPLPRVARHVPELAPDESAVWHALTLEPYHLDDLARGLRMPAGDLSATLAMLELKGLVRQVGSMLYTRA
jgi:DNA processing protein